MEKTCSEINFIMLSYVSRAQTVNDRCIKAATVHKRDAWNVSNFVPLNPIQ